MHFRQVLILILLVPIIIAFNSCKAGMAVRKGDKLYGYGEYHAASVQYGKAYRRLKSNEKQERAHTAYFRGECYRRLNQPVKAEIEYKKSIRYLYSNDTIFFRLAQTQHKNAKYKDAEKTYLQFLEKHPDDTLSLNGIYACHRIEQWSKKPARFEVKKSTLLNSRKGDFSPVLIPTDYISLIITSSAKVKKDQKPSKITGLPDNDFWISKLDKDGKWGKAVFIEGEINSEFDEGSAAFSSDGKSIYFTRCVTKSDSIESSSRSEIFKSVRSGQEWSTPEKMMIHRDSTLLFAHPAVSPDDKYLYYVSDMSGGMGGKDIWRSEMTDNIFGPPQNPGPAINTPGDELFPSFRENGEFYFASDGHPGFGGLDIFKAVIGPDSINYMVENMMQPINSNADDFGITFVGKEDKGFFTSNRKEARGWDKIWSFQIPQPQILVTGTVTDRYGEIMPDATIRIVNDKGMNTKTRTSKDGTYKFNIEKGAEYVMLGTERSYLNYSNRFSSVNKEKDTTYIADFVLTPLHRPVRIENIFFEFDKATLLQESFIALAELQKLLQDNPHIVIEIGAHTDRIGSDEYNLGLSEKRANSVVEYLQQKGIEKERLVAKGYGKSQPTKVDSYMQDKNNFLIEGAYIDEAFINSLTPQQQVIADQINRRCEFIVLKTTYKLF